MTSHHAPDAGLVVLGTKVRSASMPQAGAKWLWTWVCKAGTTACTWASVKTVLALITATLMSAMGDLLLALRDLSHTAISPHAVPSQGFQTHVFCRAETHYLPQAAYSPAFPPISS